MSDEMREVVLPSYLVQQPNGEVRDKSGRLWELYEGKWLLVLDASRDGWWRFHQHYDRDGYCDNPARGY